MEHFLCLQCFDVDPDYDSADKHVLLARAIKNLSTHYNAENPNRLLKKLRFLTYYVSYTIHKIITDCSSYEEAIKLLQATYQKSKRKYVPNIYWLTRKMVNQWSTIQRSYRP